MRAGRDSSSGEHVAGEYPKAVRAAVIVNGDMFVEETRRSAEMQREIRIHRASGDRNETGKDHEGSALRWDSDRIMYRFCSAGGCVLVAASRPQAHRVPFVPLIVNETILSIYIKRQRCQRKTARPQIANPANAGYVNLTCEHILVARGASDVVLAFSLPDSLCPWGATCLDQVPARATAGGWGTPISSPAICR